MITNHKSPGGGEEVTDKNEKSFLRRWRVYAPVQLIKAKLTS